MRFLSGLLIFCTIHMGCSSSYIVSPSSSAEQSFSTFNAAAKDENASIVFQDGRKLNAQHVVAEQDSTSFMNVTTGARTVVPTHEIQKIILTNRTLGALEGAGIGLLAGGTVGLLAAVPFEARSNGNYTGLAYLVFGVLGGATGLVVGPIIGGISGHTYEYKFVRESKKPSD